MAKLLSYNEKNNSDKTKVPLFRKVNYILMIVGVVILALGYILLIGGGSENPEVFNPEIFNVRRLRVAPLLMVIGFIIEIFAIMYHPKAKKNEDKE